MTSANKTALQQSNVNGRQIQRLYGRSDRDNYRVTGPRWTEAENPGRHPNTIRNADELMVPLTTGVLVGVGEGWRYRMESLLTILEIRERYGHILEIII